MRKLLYLSLILVFFFVSCEARRRPSNAESRTAAADSQQESEETSQTSSSGDMRQSWPTSTLYDIPEWKGITMYYGGGRSLDNFVGTDNFLMSVAAPETSLITYLETLKNDGYEIYESASLETGREFRAEKGLVGIVITDRKLAEGDGYDIVFELRDYGSWPRYNLPEFIVPMTGKMLIDDPMLFRPGEDLRGINGILVDSTGYNFQFSYTGISQAEAVKYMNDAAAKLKRGVYSTESYIDYGGFGFIKGTFTWIDKDFYVYGEVVRQDESTYIFYFGWSAEDMGW